MDYYSAMKKFIFLVLLSFSMVEAVAQDSSIIFTTDYQRSKREQVKEYLLNQTPSVTCSGETIFFRGEINHSSVSKLFKLINMKYSVAYSEIARILSEIGVNYHTDISLIPKCDDNNNIIEQPVFYFILKKSKKKEQDPVTCQPKKLVISSIGGELKAALKLYYFVRKNLLSVEIPDYGICMSACTHIRNFSESFSAGPNSLFMFHRPQVMGLTIKQKLIFKCQTYEKFIEDQELEAFWQLDNLFLDQVKEGINQWGDFFVPYHILET